jgi:hypothetical protein
MFFRPTKIKGSGTYQQLTTEVSDMTQHTPWAHAILELLAGVTPRPGAGLFGQRSGEKMGKGTHEVRRFCGARMKSYFYIDGPYFR